MPRVHLGLGTNLGDRRANLEEALERLARVVSIEAVSSVYASEPVGFRDQPEYWNLVVRAGTGLEPAALLDEAKAIEAVMGRRPAFQDAPRPIDIDLLLYDDHRVETETLRIPHPRLMERAFVLRPLVELDPGLRHPGTGQRLADRLAEGGLERVERLFAGARLLEPKGEDR